MKSITLHNPTASMPEWALLEREYLARPVRFDVVEITAQGILYVPNAFMAARS